MTNWPEPPEERIQSLEELAALRGKAIFMVSHPAILNSFTGEFSVWGDAFIQKLFVGPIICDRGYTTAHGITRARFHLFDPEFKTGSYFLTDHGDWGNDVRHDLSLFSLSEFDLGLPGQTPSRGSSLNSIFTDGDLAEVWAVQIALTYSKRPTSVNKWRGFKTKKPRKTILDSLKLTQ